jgi:uncharacterized protein YkwD
VLEKFESFFSSKRRIIAGLFVAAFILSIPFTMSQLAQRQDIRQRASAPEVTQMGPAESITNTTSTQNIVGQATGGCDALHPGLDNEEKNMIQLHNDYRAQNGLPPFAISQKLNIVAANLAEDEAANGYSAHTDSQGRGMTARFAACGVSISSAGENAANYSTTQQAFNAWVASAGHKANILSDRAAMGVGRAQRGSGWIWITDFASPNPGGTATDDNSTDTPTATSTPTKTPTPIQNNPTATPTNIPSGPTNTPTPIPAGGTISPTPTSGSNNPTPTLSGNTLSLSISLPGIASSNTLGQNNNPTPSSKTGIVELHPTSGNAAVFVLPVTFNYSAAAGTFTATFNIQTGTYNLKASTSNSLIKDLGIIQLTTGQNNTNPAALITGDLNQDNVLNLLDYNIFLSCFGTRQCSQKNNADVNMDGKVNEIDLNIFYSGLASRNGD